MNVSGCEAAHPLVLFHGWGFDSRVWQPFLPLLNAHFKVYCVDLPGFGSTAYLPWLDFSEALMRRLPERFAVLGWSLGGLLATKLALAYPDRVTHLMNIASSPSFVEHENWSGLSESVFLSYQQRLSTDPEEVLTSFITKQLPGRNEYVYPIATIEGLRAGLDCLLYWDLRQKLNMLQSPVLYLFGSRDEIVTMHTMKTMVHQYPQFQYQLIRKAGHALFLTHPEPTLTAIVNFYRDNV